MYKPVDNLIRGILTSVSEYESFSFVFLFLNASYFHLTAGQTIALRLCESDMCVSDGLRAAKRSGHCANPTIVRIRWQFLVLCKSNTNRWQIRCQATSPARADKIVCATARVGG